MILNTYYLFSMQITQLILSDNNFKKLNNNYSYYE